MNLKEAWEYLADLCENHVEYHPNFPDDLGINDSEIINVGLCSAIVGMNINNEITQENYELMNKAIAEYAEKHGRDPNCFVWENDKNGMHERMLFCLEQAHKFDEIDKEHYLETIGV